MDINTASLASKFDNISIEENDKKKYYYKILLSDVITKNIISFYGIINATKYYSIISKECRKSFVRLTRIYLEEDGILIEDKARLFSDLMNCARCACLRTGSTAISRKALSFLESNNWNTFQMFSAGFADDVMLLKGAMFSFWYGFPLTPTSGVFGYVRETAKYQTTEVCDTWNIALDLEVKYWNDNRVYGDFFVLFERRDGTIMIDKNTKIVYLVLGITQSIGNMFMAGKPSNKKLCKATSQFKDLYWTGSIIGQAVRTTLINFDGKITYDGLIVVSNLTNVNIKSLLKIYIDAVDKGKIVKSLPKHLKNPLDAIPKVKIENFPSQIIQMLKEIKDTPFDMQGSAIIFRRNGYTEKDNPDHIITLMGHGLSSRIEVVIPYQRISALIPSVQDYIKLLRNAINVVKMKPCILMIDALEQIPNLKTVFDEYNFKIHWYTPPSLEEERVLQSKNFDLMNRDYQEPINYSLCLLCKASTQPDGRPLLVCSRCKMAKYCCVEHQKQDWRKHKNNCIA